MKVLITGAAGFIGFSIAGRLLAEGNEVIGLDALNSYYDIRLKYARLEQLGINEADIRDEGLTRSKRKPLMRFVKMDLTDRIRLTRLFEQERFDCVVNLAGQAGVRYSIENPYAYVQSNVVGFLNLLENCRQYPVKHLVYASSSSVYGEASEAPFREDMNTDHPVSLYAATKKSDELMTYAYSKLYGIPATALRFFTVYGPWGRPDMAPFIFMKAITEGTPINVFNHGNLSRDFTYIDDITSAMLLVIANPPADDVPHKVYNIGHSAPVMLMDFISTIEKVTGRKAVMHMKDMQPGDVHSTYADTSRLRTAFNYTPKVSLDEGISKFYEWYKLYN